MALARAGHTVVAGIRAATGRNAAQAAMDAISESYAADLLAPHAVL